MNNQENQKRHPMRRFIGQPMQFKLLSLSLQRERLNNALDSSGYTDRRVMGYKIPTWLQRPSAWTHEQNTLFIESIWLGVGIGSFMVNSTFDETFDMILLDGQQRMRAIEIYLDGGLAIKGEDGGEYFWGDLTEQEQNQFLRIPFPSLETQYTTADEIRTAYDRHNFGGTPHTEDQRSCTNAKRP